MFWRDQISKKHKKYDLVSATYEVTKRHLEQLKQIHSTERNDNSLGIEENSDDQEYFFILEMLFQSSH